MRNWRYVTGTFQVKIPVDTDAALLPVEENTLAIFKWRLEQMSPSYRWYPVLKRYIDYISGRVKGFGGDPDSIKPSPLGVPPVKHHHELKQYTGKICEVEFDCFGDFEGFKLCSCCSEEHYFKNREKELSKIALRACKERLLVSVYVDEQKHNKICKIAVRC